MAFIHLTPDTLYRYIPLSQRREKKPLILYCKYMPAIVHDEYQRAMLEEAKEADGQEAKTEVIKSHDKKMFLNHVKKIKNYLNEDGSQNSDIKELYKELDVETRQDIIGGFSSNARLTSEQLKNLLAGLDSPTNSETTRHRSTVKPVQEKDNQKEIAEIKKD